MFAFLSSLPQIALLILVVLVIFNIIIFVHELGHFWAAKWRGLQIDRFQIWFGKPIWKKDINGVQYGLGWIPAGGFVALPQMAPMEALEGGEKPEKPLPPISAMDKIIVAFAGPLFSMLLALITAVAVWKVGKPNDFIPSTVVGYVEPGGSADKAGMKPGDRIIAINGTEVNGFAGSLDSVSERVILSRGDKITFTVERPGVDEPLTLVSGFKIGQSHWLQRRQLRDVGISEVGRAVVGQIYKNSPAEKAGIVKGDEFLKVDGEPLYSTTQLTSHLKAKDYQAAEVLVKRANGETITLSIKPVKPVKPTKSDPMIGIRWARDLSGVDTRIVHPGPIKQCADSLRMMWVTITSVIAKDSSIGIDHLSGPVGIGSLLFDLLQTENGWRRILAFVVLFNVNLAVLNMLPFPVLDGGHITLAILEKIAGRPVKAKALEVLQTACALLLISLMLYVTSKDISDRFGRGSSDSGEIVFPAD